VEYEVKGLQGYGKINCTEIFCFKIYHPKSFESLKP
jgi:hypothetical protein